MDAKKLADEAFEKIPDEEVVEAMKKAIRRRKAARAKSGCKTPGRKIRSKGKGRGLARGKGRGPIGFPFGSE